MPFRLVDWKNMLQRLVFAREQLQRFAEHAGNARNQSVHYSRKNVQDCLDAVTRLFDEVGSALLAARKIS